MEIDLENFLSNFKGKKIIFVPNPGNAGDSLIALGTYHLLKKIGINYVNGNWYDEYENSEILFGGGGNLIGIYQNCEQFIIKN